MTTTIPLWMLVAFGALVSAVVLYLVGNSHAVEGVACGLDGDCGARGAVAIAGGGVCGVRGAGGDGRGTMITRRGFFGAVAALVVGGGAARLRLSSAPRTLIGIDYGAGDATAVVTMTNRAGHVWVRDVWSGTHRYTDEQLRAKMREFFDRIEPWPLSRRDDGDTILELR